MEEFKAEDDLRPDASDRRPLRTRRPATAPRFAISRQHMMIGIGIVVLLLLIAMIGSAMKSPTKPETAQSGGARDINLSGTSSLTTNNSGVAGGTTDSHDNNGVGQTQPQTINIPPISSTPTEAPPLPAPGGAQQRVDLPGDMSTALSSQQGQVDAAVQDINTPVAGLPTAPATVMSGSTPREIARTKPLTTAKPETSTTKPGTAAKPAANATTVYIPPAVSNRSAVSSGSTGSLKSAPGSHYTLQLSGASRSDTLNAFAKQQNLQHFTVYETKRDGKPWYVLVAGNYASSEEAKRAIATLPAEVQAKKPWARPVSQVQQELKK
ncbi:SPOR domain-containing protein [Serratia sp. DD3]|uniref:SPOR domain-containing protein n=1 Tax=Serratia sp. DD3 TaxID=1410619 RepID=UPI0003C4E28B|nr:SPOR domain-containing protein [Serratia sp. DD3]KEY58664.1 cell division protein DamX [Serratia sp. DD3]